MYQRATQGWMKHLDFIVLDVLSLHLAYICAYLLRHAGGSPYANNLYMSMAVVITVVDILVSILFDTMHNILKRGWYQEFASMVKHAVMVFIILTVYLFSLQRGEDYSRITMYMTSILHIPFGYALRQAWKQFLLHRSVKDEKRAMLIVTDSASASGVIANLRSTPNEFVHIVGLALIDGDAIGQSIDDIPVVATLADASAYICRKWVDEVFIALPDGAERPETFIRQCSEMGVTIHESMSLKLDMGQKQFVEKLGSYTVLTSSINYATPIQSLLKRLMDIAGGLVGCLFTLLIVLIVGPKIKKASPGPIFFTQERIGKNGRRFKLIKLRSMYLDAEERKKELMSQNRVADGMMFKLDFDPRIIGNEILPDGTRKTGIGEFIRKTSLDEFPQFFNVLMGDMSLVGTRPPTVDEWDKYELHHRARLAMKPGITGMWQVSGRSNITDFEEVVKLDTYYICNWSLGLDFKILGKTVTSLLKREGAM